jgi:hypothetical protein
MWRGKIQIQISNNSNISNRAVKNIALLRKQISFVIDGRKLQQLYLSTCVRRQLKQINSARSEQQPPV